MMRLFDSRHVMISILWLTMSIDLKSLDEFGAKRKQPSRKQSVSLSNQILAKKITTIYNKLLDLIRGAGLQFATQ